MKIIGSPCGGCCGCFDCCEGSSPAEWLLSFSFSNNALPLYNCSLCVSFLTGDYVLAQQTCQDYSPGAAETDETECCWTYNWSGDEECLWDGTDPDLHFHLTDIAIVMQVKCYEGTLHVTTLWFTVTGYYEEDPTHTYAKRWFWTRAGAPTFAYTPLAIDNCTDETVTSSPWNSGLIAKPDEADYMWSGCADLATVLIYPQP